MTMTPEQALARLQRLCSRSEKCPADARRKLQEWGISDTAARSLIARLQADKYIDEQRYAQAFVRDKHRLTHWGMLKIRQALQAKQLPADTIAAALQEIDPDSYKQELLELLVRKNATIKAASPEERQAKLLRFALGRGFEYAAVYELLPAVLR